MKHSRPKIGSKFGDLTVIASKSSKGKYHVICECICSEKVHVSMYHLFSGNTTSCRCQRSKIESRGPGAVSLKGLYDTYIRNADKRSVKFSLLFQQFVKLVSSNCHYCEAEPKPFNKYLTRGGKQKRKDKKYKETTILLAEVKVNGIDRKNNEQGYTVKNSIPCCKICNRAKNDMSYEEFCAWIDRIRRQVS